MLGDQSSLARLNFVEGLFGSRGLGSTGIGHADLAPIVGSAFGAQEAWRETGDPKYTVAAMLPGAGPLKSAGKAAAKKAGNLASDLTSRMGRSRNLGYADDVFYRGDRTGAVPQSFPEGGFFSRNREISAEIARVGGRDAPEEYRLNLQNTFSDHQPVNAANYARIVTAVRERDPALAADLVDQIAPGKSIDWFMGFARHRPEMTVAINGGPHVRQPLEQALTEYGAQSVFRKAGYDALDFGTDVLKLGDGIRSKDAMFDPAKRKSIDVLAGVAGTVGAGAALGAMLSGASRQSKEGVY